MELKKILKALLLSTSEGLIIKDIQDLFRRFRKRTQEGFEKALVEDYLQFEEALKIPEFVSVAQVRDAMEELNQELEDTDDVYRIMENVDGYRLVVSADWGVWVSLFRNNDKPMKLSQAVIETLALIAYRQPVTRAEIELIRGVSVDNALNKLLDLDLVIVRGHANLPGKPRLYVTTERFLDFCGIRSLKDLPASDILSPAQIKAWVQEAGARERYTEQDLGLSSSSVEGATEISVHE